MKTKNLLYKYFDIIETILILVFAIGMVMILKELKYAFWVLKISLGVLAFLYWSKTLKKDDSKSTKEKISEKFIWYSLLLTPIAIISKFQFNENANYFLLFCLVTLISSGIYRIIERKKAEQKINIGEITRLLIAIILTFSVFTLPLPTIN